MIKDPRTVSSLQSKVLAWLSLSLGMLMMVFVWTNFFVYKLPYLALIDLIFGIVSFLIYIRARRGDYKVWHVYGYVLAIFLILTMASLLAPLLKGVFFWVFVLPIVLYVLLGVRGGFYLSLSLLVFECVVFYLKAVRSELSFPHLSVSLNFLASYSTVWVLCHVYEFNRASAEASLYRLANTDILTDSYNRLAFNCHCDGLIKSQSSFYLLLLDVDFFKQINDRYGHEMGDSVLKSLSTTVTELVGKHHFFRYGGEEFCVVLASPISETVAREKAELIRQTIENMTLSDNHDIKLTVSIGFVASQPGMSLSELLNKADKRMYQAKKNGRNQVCAN